MAGRYILNRFSFSLYLSLSLSRSISFIFYTTTNTILILSFFFFFFFFFNSHGPSSPLYNTARYVNHKCSGNNCRIRSYRYKNTWDRWVEELWVVARR
jgi:hypothetical protein